MATDRSEGMLSRTKTIEDVIDWLRSEDAEAQKNRHYGKIHLTLDYMDGNLTVAEFFYRKRRLRARA